MRYLQTILALMLSILLIGCEQSAQTASSQDTSGVTEIYLFGDDLSVGAGVTSYAEIIASTESVSLVDKTYADSIVNNTLRIDWLNGIESNDIIIINCGFNDVRWYGNTYSSANLDDDFIIPFIQAAKLKTSHVYVIGPVKMKASSYALNAPFNNGSDIATMNFNSDLSSIATTLGVQFIDITSFNPSVANLDVSEELPNDTGHAEIASIIYNQVGF